MAKSLQEAAKAILMKESDDPTPDRDAKLMTPNKATLRPGSGPVEGRFANPGANSTGEGEYEDLGAALVNPTDIPPSAKASGSAKKDTSKSSQSQVPPQPAQSVQEEDEIEISEELEAFITSMIEEGKSEEEIAEAISENFEVVEEGEEEVVEEEALEEKKDEKEEDSSEDGESEDCSEEVAEQISMKEHIDALLSGENLSEDFRTKAETLFESAVTLRLNEEVKVMEEAYTKALNEEVEKITEQMSNTINDYLGYVVEQWMVENEIAIESGLRTEITEEFITGFKNLMEENNFDLPEEKVNVVEKLAETVQEKDTRLNEEIATNVQLTKKLAEANRKLVFKESCEGLTETQISKLGSLVENVESETVEDFSKKLSVIKENYFPTKKSTVKPSLDMVETSDGKNNALLESSPRMNAYVNSLGRASKVL